jgi:integrase
MANKSSKKSNYRTFGSIRELGPNKFQASYKRKVDGKIKTFYGPGWFPTKTEANKWLTIENGFIISGKWTVPGVPDPANTESPTFGAFARRHIGLQTTSSGESLKPSTKEKYESYLKNQLSALCEKPIHEITKPVVDEWWTSTIRSGKLTTASKCYKLLHTVMNRAVADGWVTGANPCQVKGAQNAVTGKELYTPSIEEVVTVANHISPKYRVAVLLSTYGALRFGELTALQRKHLTLTKVAGVERYELQIDQGVTYVGKQFNLGTTKNAKGKGSITLVSGITPIIKEFLASSVDASPEALLFPAASGSYLRNDYLARALKVALRRSGLAGKGITPHSLRRAGATAYANQGANLGEVQDFLRDASPAAALRYVKSTNRAVDLMESMPIPAQLDTQSLV